MVETWTMEEFQHYLQTGKTPERFRQQMAAGGKKPHLPRKSRGNPDPKRWENLLYSQLTAQGLQPVREYRFHKTRKWRFDMAFPDLRIAVEVEGGTWSGGRHVRGEGYENDCEKYNEAELDGWSVLRFTSSMVKKGAAIATVKKKVQRQTGESSHDNV